MCWPAMLSILFCSKCRMRSVVSLREPLGCTEDTKNGVTYLRPGPVCNLRGNHCGPSCSYSQCLKMAEYVCCGKCFIFQMLTSILFNYRF